MGITINYSALHSAWANTYSKVAKVALLKMLNAFCIFFIIVSKRCFIIVKQPLDSCHCNLMYEKLSGSHRRKHGSSHLGEILYERALLWLWSSTNSILPTRTQQIFSAWKSNKENIGEYQNILQLTKFGRYRSLPIDTILRMIYLSLMYRQNQDFHSA